MIDPEQGFCEQMVWNLKKEVSAPALVLFSTPPTVWSIMLAGGQLLFSLYFCNSIFTSLSLDFYSGLFDLLPIFLWLYLKEYLVGVDLLFQQQHELPEVARLEAGVEVAGGDKEGRGDLDQVRLRFI